MKRILTTAAVLGTLVAAQAAEATMTMSLSGLAGTGVTGEVSFSYQSLSDTSSKITIAIENTTSAGIGGFITGFAFNVPTMAGVSITSIGGDVEGGAVTVLGAPNESGWWVKFDYEDIKTPNDAGDFDFGVKNNNNGNSFITGGSGNGSKIEIGETTTFTFNLVGTGLDNFTNGEFEGFFLGAISSDDPSGEYSFGARFQGLTDGGSDLAVNVNMVPLPGAALLSLLGLGGVAVRRRVVG